MGLVCYARMGETTNKRNNTGQSRVYISYSEGIAEGRDHAGRGFEADSQATKAYPFSFLLLAIMGVDRSVNVTQTIY